MHEQTTVGFGVVQFFKMVRRYFSACFYLFFCSAALNPTLGIGQKVTHVPSHLHRSELNLLPADLVRRLGIQTFRQDLLFSPELEAMLEKDLSGKYLINTALIYLQALTDQEVLDELQRQGWYSL